VSAVRLRGAVNQVLFEDHRGFAVVRLQVDGSSIRVVGTLGRVNSGETWSVTGRWEDHPEHGRQLRATAGVPVPPDTREEQVALLSGDRFPGIGPSTASRVVDAYGDRLWHVLEHDPERLEKDAVVTPYKAKVIKAAVSALRARWSLFRFLADHRLSMRLIGPLTTLYQAEAVERLTENPYRLLAFTNWETADGVAGRVGVAPWDRRRVQAGLVAVLQERLGNGHTALPLVMLVQRTAKLLRLDESAVVQAAAPPAIHLVANSGEDLTQLPGIASQERTVAEVIATLTSAPKPLADAAWVDLWLDRYEQKLGRPMDQDQRQAVRAAVNSRLLILTGGPGTGKTTTIDAIRAVLHDLGQEVVLSAPTGRAARRMQQATGEETKTLHRLFGYSQQSFAFRHTDQHLPSLIVDECSMVDTRLWSAVATAMGPDSRLVLAGDAGQLPPVGPGEIFASLVDEPRLPVVQLTRIHRQAADNPIPHVAAAIRRGEVPHLPAWEGQTKGVYLIAQADEAKGALWTVRLAAEGMPKYGVPFEHVQILTPRRGGLAGTQHLNSLMRTRLGQRDAGPTVPFAPGDRVIQTVNNYDLGESGVANGTTGMVLEILEDGVVVDFEGEKIRVTGGAVGDLDHAYAISVHKSQGSQYRAVATPLYASAGRLLSRTLVYTAITRATDLVVIVGTQEMMAQAVKNHSPSGRLTAFRPHLRMALDTVPTSETPPAQQRLFFESSNTGSSPL